MHIALVVHVPVKHDYKKNGQRLAHIFCPFLSKFLTDWEVIILAYNATC